MEMNYNIFTMEVEKKKEEVKRDTFGGNDTLNHQHDSRHSEYEAQIRNWFNIYSSTSLITANDVGCQDGGKSKFTLFESIL